MGVAFVCGIKFKKLRKAVLKTGSLEHRLEFVREVAGIKYYNDSAATIPQAAVAAIKSFKEPIILIAGGSDKNLDFSEMGKIIADKVKGAIFLKGDATEKLIAEIRKNIPEREHFHFEIKDSMHKAVEEATRSAEKGDVILLSPGAASFGIFANEFDRGHKFKEAVEKIKK